MRPARRKIVGLSVRRVGTGTEVAADGATVSLLTKALAAQRRGTDRKVEARVGEAASLVMPALRSALAADTSPGDMEFIGSVAGGKVTCTFTYRVCLGAGWEVEKTWKAKIQDRCEVPGGPLRGLTTPLSDETERDVAVLLRAMVERALVAPLSISR